MTKRLFILMLVSVFAILNKAHGMTTSKTCNENLRDSMHIVLLGDSNTWLGGDDCTSKRGWNTWFAQSFPHATCVSYARSGATWTNTRRTTRNLTENVGRISDNNVIYNQVCRLIAACRNKQQAIPQLIIVAAGTNDAWFENKRSQAFSIQNATQLKAMPNHSLPDLPHTFPLSLAASVQYDCLLLKKHFPQTRIILFTPLQTTAVSENKIAQTGNIIEQVGHALNLDVVRQDKICCVKRTEELKHFTNTYDGTHTNEQGAQKNGIILANTVAKLLKGGS